MHMLKAAKKDKKGDPVVGRPFGNGFIFS